MTLVKLDSGDYINTEAVDSIKSGYDPYLVMRCGDVISITHADRYHIVEAMGGELGPYFQKLANEQKASLVKTIKRWDATLTDLSKNLSDPCDRVEYTTMSLCLHELKAAVQ